ncbi:MAG TPA: hypothetical protein VJV05_09570 [Pyrinomonadaceae bacterium]|nr:hypothetical protein [Pyrinomonadaceae bacterium]
MTTYPDPAIDKIYELLFCDNLELYRGSDAADHYPWTTVLADSPEVADLEKIVNDDELETRPKILAANLLRSLGQTDDSKELFGVIVEVGMDEGLDTLAAYEDGTARYINYTGSMVVWETRTAESDELIAELFGAARNVVAQIGPWDAARLNRPQAGNVRLSFLVSDGLYFGEGPFSVLAQDSIGGPVIGAATKLMQVLVSRRT